MIDDSGLNVQSNLREFAKIRGTFEKSIFGREPLIAGLVTLGLVELANCLKGRLRASYSNSRTHSSASSHCCAPFLRGIMNRHTTVSSAGAPKAMSDLFAKYAAVTL